MIKANELRIGNYVTIDNTQSHPHMKDVTVKVTSINEMVGNNYFPDSTHSVSVIDEKKYRSGYSQANEFISPIPLSEDILLRMGFVKDSNNNYYKDGKFTIYNRFGNYGLIGGSLSWNEFKYLHQLQNLYFALIGTELTLNP